ncbi:MAG: heme exporter protein CcmB [Chromatiales bacterium]|jgi:heme exporter protein B|nr:heme exporter protein CcmB [Chromatiales bacterium]
MWARAFIALVKRDLRLAARRPGDVANPLLFFMVAISLFPLGVSPRQEVLAQIAPGVVWVAALLATLLALDGLFRSDFEDGTLEQILLSPVPAPLLVGAKITAHWIVTGVPLIVCAPVLGVSLSLPDGALLTLVATLSLGTPILSLVGAIGIALTVGLRRGGALLALLVLPLYVPVLIFGAHAVSSAAAGLPVTGQLLLMSAMLVLAVTLAPLAAAAALRVTVG